MNDSIYRPQYTQTPSMKAVLALIDRERWLFERMLLMPKYEAWMERDVQTSRVVATTAIEGEGVSRAVVERLARQGAGSRADDAERANLNALHAYEFVDYLTDQGDIRIDEMVIRELNRQFMRGSSDLLTPGVYRKGQNQILGYMPPNQGDVPALMREFANWIIEPDDETHPVIKASLTHIQFVAIHPFWDGNGRTGRALMTLLIQRAVPEFKKLLSVEATVQERRNEYFRALEQTLGAGFSSSYDATPWLEFALETVYQNVFRLSDRLREWHQMMERVRGDFGPTGLLDRQIDAIAFAHHTGQITRSDYIEITGVSPMTASRDLARLVKEEMLEAHGKTRDRVYVPKVIGVVEANQLVTPPEQGRLIAAQEEPK